jgi:hypothetical protein
MSLFLITWSELIYHQPEFIMAPFLFPIVPNDIGLSVYLLKYLNNRPNPVNDKEST